MVHIITTPQNITQRRDFLFVSCISLVVSCEDTSEGGVSTDIPHSSTDIDTLGSVDDDGFISWAQPHISHTQSSSSSCIVFGVHISLKALSHVVSIDEDSSTCNTWVASG